MPWAIFFAHAGANINDSITAFSEEQNLNGRLFNFSAFKDRAGALMQKGLIKLVIKKEEERKKENNFH